MQAAKAAAFDAAHAAVCTPELNQTVRYLHQKVCASKNFFIQPECITKHASIPDDCMLEGKIVEVNRSVYIIQWDAIIGYQFNKGGHQHSLPWGNKVLIEQLKKAKIAHNNHHQRTDSRGMRKSYHLQHY